MGDVKYYGEVMKKEIRNKDWEKVLTWCGLHIHSWGEEYGMLGEVTCKTCGASDLKYLDDTGKRWTYLPSNPYPLTIDMLYQYPITKLQDKGYSITLVAYECSGYFVEIKDEIHEGESVVAYGSESLINALFNSIVKVVDNGK